MSCDDDITKPAAPLVRTPYVAQLSPDLFELCIWNFSDNIIWHPYYFGMPESTALTLFNQSVCHTLHLYNIFVQQMHLALQTLIKLGIYHPREAGEYNLFFVQRRKLREIMSGSHLA